MRGRTVRRLLLPHILRLFLLGLVTGALVLTVILMVRLAIDLVDETNHMNTSQLTYEQMIHYIKHFFVLSLFGALQLLGASAFMADDSNPHNRCSIKWRLFGWLSFGCGICLLVDSLLSHGTLAVGIFMTLQGVLVAIHSVFLPVPASLLLSSEGTNVHYIQMPPEVPALTGRKSPKFLPF